jgi:Ca2+-binding EF-hand superfamily protein
MGRLLSVVVIALGLGSTAYAQGAGGAESDQASGEAKSAAKPPKVRQRVTMKLPDEYRSKDKDKDGQIGMYEWSRSDYATFRKLDLNGDGFLTPMELSRKGKAAGRSAAAVMSTRTDPTPAAGASPSAPVTTETAADGTPAAAGVSRSEAERQFELVDKDKNGKVTEEEFQKSIMAKLKFTKAGIALSFPVGRDEFIRLYPSPK